MLPDDAFEPLDLDVVLDRIRGSGDGEGAIVVLERALVNPLASEDDAVRDCLDALVEAYDVAGRQREAIGALSRIAERQPGLRGAATDTVAGLYARLGEPDAAMTLVHQRYAEQQALPAAQRDIACYAAGAMTAGKLVGDLDFARRLISAGQVLASERDCLDGQVLLALIEARLFPDDFAERLLDEVEGMRAARVRKPIGPGRSTANHRPRQPGPARRVAYRVAYFPESQYATARRQRLLDATMYPSHQDYRREIQQTLESVAISQGVSVRVVPLDVAGLLDYAAAKGRDPASRATRLDFSNALDGDGRDIPWPPQRNASCWCGSRRKYKKCCGAPGFSSVRAPDPASLLLKIELDHVEPQVWRRVAAPSNIALDQLHQVIQAAMGWHDEHPYLFENDEVTIIDPRSDSADIKADGERLVCIANEVGQRFTYVYDFGDSWTHTLTLEEIREAGSENVPEVLDGAGACPPENCGGPARYLALLDALRDAANPDHDETVERFGEDYDPAAYRRPPSPVGGRV
jgi:hypothetical protein